MFDKEKLEKENEQFSSAILYVATAVYVGVCAMVFGALYAKLPSLGEAFLEMMKDYGTVLAGIPVLVAVVVAKQQLDANRRQHVATIKLKFKEERELLQIISRLPQFIIQTDYRKGCDMSDDVGDLGYFSWRFSEDQKKTAFRLFGDYMLQDMKTLEYSLNQIRISEEYHIFGDGDSETDLDAPSTPESCYSEAKKVAEKLDRRIFREYSNLSQYWS